MILSPMTSTGVPGVPPWAEVVTCSVEPSEDITVRSLPSGLEDAPNFMMERRDVAQTFGLELLVNCPDRSLQHCVTGQIYFANSRDIRIGSINKSPGIATHFSADRRLECVPQHVAREVSRGRSEGMPVNRYRNNAVQNQWLLRITGSTGGAEGREENSPGNTSGCEGVIGASPDEGAIGSVNLVVHVVSLARIHTPTSKFMLVRSRVVVVERQGRKLVAIAVEIPPVGTEEVGV